MNQQVLEMFTKYEIARIIGARALQIAMDAPLLLKLSQKELEEVKFDALKLAEKELDEGALPISIHRPSPRRGKDKLAVIKDDETSDEELIEKEKQEEKQIAESAEDLGLENAGDLDESTDLDSDSSEEQ